MTATAIYNDGRNNFQTNYGMDIESAKRNFQSEMENRKARWGKLMLVENGELIDTYPRSEQAKSNSAEKQLFIHVGNEGDSELPTLQTLIFDEPMVALQASKNLLEMSYSRLEQKDDRPVKLLVSGKVTVSD